MAESADNPSLHPCENCGTPIDTSGEPPLSLIRCPNCDHRQLVNTQFHHFQLLEILGSGGMGAVYRALDLSLNRPVALKLLRTEHMEDDSIVAQFEREAAITAAINHPHVVKIFSTGCDRGTIYIVMELVDKGSLDDLMTLQGRISEAQVLEVGVQIAQGLQAAWRNGLLHRDVKPGNILFADAHTAKVVDFGLAAFADQAIQIGGEVWGTPYYVAPEKLETPPEEDFRSDMYSLGSALFHAVAGRPPYEAEETSIVVLKVLKSQPVNLQSFAPDVSNATAYVIDRMLKKDPNERYQSYEDLIEHLQYARREISEGVLPLGLPVPPKKTSRWVMGSVVVLVVLIGLLFYLSQQPQIAPPAEDPVVKQRATEAAAAAEQAAAARQILLAGDPGSIARAAEAFRALDRDGVAQPLRTWCALQAGLAQMLAGQSAEAAAAFRQIAERIPASADAMGEKLAKFFLETATFAAGEGAVAGDLASRLDAGSYEAFGLLVGGVKNWSLAEFPTAVQFLTRFQSATPGGSDAWIAEYQPLAGALLADYQTYTGAAEGAAAASAPGKKKDALTAVRESAGRLKFPGALATKLAALQSQLEAEAKAYEAEMAKQMAAHDAADAAMLRDLQPRIDDYCRRLQFAKALTLANDVKLKGENQMPALALMRQKLEWLEEFKRTFFTDLRDTPYRSELRNSAGGSLGAGIWHPTEKGVNIMTERGFVEAGWEVISPETIIPAAEWFFRPPLTPEQIAERKWGLGLYLLAVHQVAAARTRLEEGSAARAEYRDALPRLGLAPQ